MEVQDTKYLIGGDDCAGLLATLEMIGTHKSRATVSSDTTNIGGKIDTSKLRRCTGIRLADFERDPRRARQGRLDQDNR